MKRLKPSANDCTVRPFAPWPKLDRTRIPSVMHIKHFIAGEDRHPIYVDTSGMVHDEVITPPSMIVCGLAELRQFCRGIPNLRSWPTSLPPCTYFTCDLASSSPRTSSRSSFSAKKLIMKLKTSLREILSIHQDRRHRSPPPPYPAAWPADNHAKTVPDIHPAPYPRRPPPPWCDGLWRCGKAAKHTTVSASRS